MAIQQVAGSSSNGIMSILFQDDGSTEGMAAENAGFAKTLRHMLGEHEDSDAAQTSERDASTNAAEEASEVTAPQGTGLETPTSNFALPGRSARSTGEADLKDGKDNQAVAQPFSVNAHFIDTLTTLQDGVPRPQQDAALTTEDTAQDFPAAAPPTPVFAKGIEHVVNLAREVQHASATLQQPPSQAQGSNTARGRNAPVSGKVLPPGFRPVTTAFSKAMAGAQAHGVKADAMSEALPSSSSGTAFETAFNGALVSEHASSESRSQGQATAAAAQMLQGLRGDNALSPNLPKVLASESAATPTMQLASQYLAGSDAWFEDLGTRVDWLKNMNIESADLQLHPAELGLLEIHIATNDDATTVSFVTHNAAARELIEDSLPRLRELLANQGMQLGDSQVSQQSEGQRREQELQQTASQPKGSKAADEPAATRRTVYVADPNRIDHYV